MRLLAFGLILLGLAVLAASLTSCLQGSGQPEASTNDRHARREALPVPTPLKPESTYFELAGGVQLPPEKPVFKQSRIENLYRLSTNIWSGGEPLDPDALRELSARGVKTILSVDGKVPDEKTAAALGMRYVHIPIRYSEITDEELLQISKTFRELEGPFFVHCFHGKHRGPAAAAVGRVVLDGASREQAVAEMRQWMGTSKSYEGLYTSVAGCDIPDAKVTASYAFDFPAARTYGGLRDIMVEMTRAFDHLGYLSETDFGPNPKHPDLVAAAESDGMRRLFELMAALEDHTARKDDFKGWTDSSLRAARELDAILKANGTGQPLANPARAIALYEQIEKDCIACHKAYRN